MADEINRASPRTQSALLQAMQEHHVTVAGVRHDVPRPFHVLATQNPLEQEGTYPLPEAQLDRFLLQIDVSYPDEAAERRMVLATTGVVDQTPKSVLSADELMIAQRVVRELPVGDQVVDAILKLVRSARPGTGIDKDLDEMIAWGPGPRASQALMLAVRAKALVDGRLAPSVDDVIELAEPILKHRMALTFAARAEGVQMSDMVERLVRPLGLCEIGKSNRESRAAFRGGGIRGEFAYRAHAGPPRRGTPRRPHRHARHSWAQTRRTRRNLLAIPPFRPQRRLDADRLAAFGKL
jgi:MoxR-like ATPase